MTTAADIVNRALQLCGGYNNFGPVTGSAPAFGGQPQGIAAGVVYNEVVQSVGRKFGWDFSRSIATLTATGNTPPLGWVKEYIYPTNGIQLRQVLPATAVLDPNNPRPYRWTIGNALGGSTPATGSISFAANPSNGQTITLNSRVFTFVNDNSGWPNNHTNYKINIGFDLGGTMFFLADPNSGALTTGTTYLADGALNVADYATLNTGAAWLLTVSYIVPGTIGNTYTLAASTATPSGATLTGGSTSQQKVIWTDIVNAQGVISNQPPENTWDALYAEAVVQELAAKLNQALASKPESAKLAHDIGIAAEQVGEIRTDT